MPGPALEIVAKSDPAQRLVFGWAVLTHKRDGSPLTDLQGDEVTPADLEHAVYDYVEWRGQGGEMHAGPAESQLVESMVFTTEKIAKLGIPDGTLPQGWWSGFRVAPDLFGKVQLGDRLMFSIEGHGARAAA